jgi:N-acetylglucosamine-6-phosphate deacetylase
VSTLIAGRLARGGELLDGWVEVDGERIVALGTGTPPRQPTEYEDGIIAPGLVDLQVNGAGGYEVTGGVEALDAIDAIQLAHGVTSYLPTLVSPDPDAARHLLPALARRAADPFSPVVGVHVEGPYISPEHAGMHPAERLLSPPAELPDWLRSPAIRMITLAPELKGSLGLVAALRARAVVVSLGHSGARAEQALAAAEAGARMVTHVFNGMAPLHHREPGLAGAALADERLLVSVIADGVHVDPLVLELVRRTAAGRVVLVSDSTPAAAAAPGGYRMAGVRIERAPDGAVRTADGSMAGSALTLDQAVRGWASLTGASLAEAIRAASEEPAAALGLTAALAPGASADLVSVDEAGTVRRVMRRGRWLGGR